MAIYRSSDSLSRCDPNIYSNMFDTRKHPDIKLKPTIRTTPKDTLEISRDKLKKEALNRLRHTSQYMVAYNGFMRIGKYLFLAVAFPPYILLYGLPKWILVEGMTVVFSVMTWIGKKVQHQSQKYLDKGMRKLIQFMQFTQQLTQILIQPMIHFTLKIRQGFLRLKKDAFQFLKHLKIKKKLKLPSLDLNKKFISVRNRLSTLKEKGSQYIEKITSHIHEGVQWIKESPQLILGWSQIQFQRFSQHTDWKNRFQTSQNIAQKATDWIFEGFKKVTQTIKWPFIPLINFYQKKWVPQWEKVQKHCGNQWRNIQDFFHRKHQRSLAFLQHLEAKVKRSSSQRVLDFLINHAWIKKCSMQFQEFLKKYLSHFITHLICEKGVKIYVLIAGCALKGTIYLLQAITQANTFLFQLFHLIKSSLKKVTQINFNFLKNIQKNFYQFCSYTMYYFLLAFVMTMILCMWGIQLLSEYMNNLTIKMSFIRKQPKNSLF